MAYDNLFAAMRAPQARAVAFGLSATSVDQTIFIADRAYEVTGAREIHSVAGGAAAAVTVKKDTGTGAPVSGNTVLASGFDLTATANTVQTRLATTVNGDRVLAAGDRLSLDFSGTLTGLAGCTVVVSLKPVQG